MCRTIHEQGGSRVAVVTDGGAARVAAVTGEQSQRSMLLRGAWGRMDEGVTRG